MEIRTVFFLQFTLIFPKSSLKKKYFSDFRVDFLSDFCQIFGPWIGSDIIFMIHVQCTSLSHTHTRINLLTNIYNEEKLKNVIILSFFNAHTVYQKYHTNNTLLFKYSSFYTLTHTQTDKTLIEMEIQAISVNTYTLARMHSHTPTPDT